MVRDLDKWELTRDRVGGHSWAVKRFFDVDVYQKSKAT